MANLPESSSFDAGVYQIETTDPVVGGPSGVSNAPLKNLANRTKYLKDHVDALESSRAPLASPAFTGSPTGPTAPQFDADTSLATTAFVKRQGVQHGSVEVIAVSKNLSVTNVGGNVIAYGNTAPITLTLPSSTDCPEGACVSIFNVSYFDLTIAAVASDKINPALGIQQTMTLAPGETISLTLYGNYWEVFSGTGNIKHMPSFAGSYSNRSGYQKFPSGLIMQWGTYSGAVPAGAEILQYYPIQFPTQVESVVATIASSSSGNYPIITNVNYGWLNYFKLRNNGTASGSDFGWVAFGR